ncbi:MAG: low-specificity L-threonine aldolase [Chloroflexi bacterium]|nr:low-specificity L-threonine aldolase [Chloroflexota bacterium]
MRVVDLRSDTVTHPTPEMRQAMAEAEVGDDVYGEDPTLNRLEAIAAEMLGKEAAMFVASGTMGNLVSILTHAQRGDEIIVGDQTHIFRNEAGGASALGGVSYYTLRNDDRGMLDPDEVEEAIRPNNVHYPRTAMIAIENTHNNCGGAVLTPEDTKAIADVAHRHEIPLHIDGARIFNAAVSLETPVSELVKDADSVTFCLSKGLSVPIGSIVCGSNEFIERADRWRKMVGGGMRQVGIIAAAGIVALESMVDRLAEDHANARKLAEGLSKISGISIDPDSLPTNIVRFDVTARETAEIARKLNERGVKGGSPARSWRFVTHYGITSDDIDYVLDAVESTFKEYLKA